MEDAYEFTIQGREIHKKIPRPCRIVIYQLSRLSILEIYHDLIDTHVIESTYL